MTYIFNCPTKGCPIQGQEIKVWPVVCACGVTQAGPNDKPIASKEAYAKKPSLIRRGLNYKREKGIWKAAGKPVRTEAERQHIFEKKCLPCPHFVKEKDDKKKGGVCGYCSLCGCPIQQKATSLNDKLTWATTKCPADRWGEPMDVVFGIRHPSKSWYELCGNIPAQLLAKNNTKAAVESLTNDKNQTRSIIEDHKPKLFINVAMALGHAFVNELASIFPNTKFLTINHSSQAHLASVSNWLPQQLGHILATQARPNCYFATPDERNIVNALIDNKKCLHIPNAIRHVDAQIRPLTDKITLSLVGRWDVLKNTTNQILAAGLINKQQPSKLIGCFHNPAPAILTAATRLAGVEYSSFQWGDLAAYTDMIQGVDIGLQVSFTESFNFVAIEHLMAGKPVVGSDAIRYLPAKWQAKADDPEDIARVALSIIDDYDNAAKEAAEIGTRYAEQCNTGYVKAIKSLLE